jgi:hypothetical protein
MYFQWEEEEEEHRMMAKRTMSQICPDTGPKSFYFFISSFFTQSMDGPVFFKTVASKISPQLPTLPRGHRVVRFGEALGTLSKCNPIFVTLLLLLLLLFGLWRLREIPVEDVPEVPRRMRLVRRHDRERHEDLHKVPSPRALQFQAHPQDMLRVLLLPTTWAHTALFTIKASILYCCCKAPYE